MGASDKLLLRILHGRSDADISFGELCRLLKRPGFDERVRGGHHIFTKDLIEEILNRQPAGSKAKSYQVKQVRNIVLRYGLKLEENNED